MARFRSKKAGILKIGASTIPSAYILPKVLPGFAKKRDAYFTIQQTDSAGVIAALKAGGIDVGFTGMRTDEPGLVFYPFLKDRVVIITPVSEKFLEMKAASSTPVKELLKEPVILRKAGSGSKKAADMYLSSIGVKEEDLNVCARINDQETIKNLVAGGMGISMVSARAAEDLAAERRIIVFELSGAAGRELYAVCRADRAAEPEIAGFIEYVKGFFA